MIFAHSDVTLAGEARNEVAHVGISSIRMSKRPLSKGCPGAGATGTNRRFNWYLTLEMISRKRISLANIVCHLRASQIPFSGP